MENAPLSSRPPRAGARSDRARRTVGVVTVAAVAGGLTAYGVSQFMGAEVIICVLLAGLVIAPVAVRAMAGTFDVFEPAVIIAGVYFFYFVLGPIVRVATDDLSFLDRNFEAIYVPALLAVAVAVVAMWLGYALPVGPAAAPADQPMSPLAAASVRDGRRVAGMLLVGAGLGMVVWAGLAGRSLLYFLLPGVTQPGGNTAGGLDVPYFFFAVEWFIPAITVLIALGGLRRPLSRVVVVGVLSVVYISLGFRYRVAVLWFAVAIVTYLRAGRRPRLSYMAVPTVLAFLLGGWLAGARAFFRSGGATGTLAFDLRTSLMLGLSDTRIFETLGAVLTTVPRFLPRAGLLPFFYPVVLLVPRTLWPGKPYPFWLQYYVQSFGTPIALPAGAAAPHFGEFYIAFGWPGIAIGMFLFGVGAKWLWRWYRAAPNDPWRQAIFALNSSLLFLAIIRGYFAQIVQEWCFVVLPAVVIAAVARRRARRSAGAALIRSAEVVADA